MRDVIFTINSQKLDELFERYEKCFTGLAEEWGLNPEEALPPEFQNYFSQNAHCREHVESLLLETFWASYQLEEGRHHGFEIVYCNRDLANSPFVFEESRPFDADNLAKLSPAIPKSASIGVWPDTNNELCVWGFEPEPSNQSGPCFRMKVLQSGTIIAGVGGEGYFIALLNRGHADFVDDSIFDPVERRLDDSIEDLGSGRPEVETAKYFSIMHVAKVMYSHGHGGTLLVVPTEKGDWEQSINWKYKAGYAFERASDNHYWDLIGQLTAIDGATVITRDLTILGFGAKITCESVPDVPVQVRKPIEGCKPEQKKITELGGTRHQSAARFVGNHNGSIAVVASQDGKVSFIVWDEDSKVISMTEHAEWQLIR